MDNILEEASAVLQCKSCPWYKNCVTPMRLSSEDIQKQLKSVMGTGGAEPSDNQMRQFMESAAAALQNAMLEGCPVFIYRLRNSEKLAQTIKKLMQTSGTDTEPSKGASK